MDKIALTDNNLSLLIEHFKDDMVDYIVDHWDDECYEKMSRSEAETYLGHSVKGMSQTQINEEISSIQLAYYEEGVASNQKITDTFLRLLANE